ncbi:MAG TPA: TetR/AcrR family transcriptional regulator [Jatrophihabitantaceae bacterium]|nr:TetR/AcrR family transcriptional regulator [Jatrophihabitantaceae bacterium]
MTATPADETPPLALGLRERSKLRRRNRILRTAMRLFTEHGYEATTVAEIAAAAELAPRTVTGYFPNKIDLATAVGDGMSERLTAALTAPGHADFVTVLDRWMTAEITSPDFELVQLAAAMNEANPQVARVNASNGAEASAAGAAVIAHQIGAPPDHPAVAICVAAVSSALGTYLSRVAKLGPDEQLEHWFLAFINAMLRDAQLATD